MNFPKNGPKKTAKAHNAPLLAENVGPGPRIIQLEEGDQLLPDGTIVRRSKLGVSVDDGLRGAEESYTSTPQSELEQALRRLCEADTGLHQLVDLLQERLSDVLRAEPPADVCNEKCREASSVLLIRLDGLESSLRRTQYQLHSILDRLVL